MDEIQGEKPSQLKVALKEAESERDHYRELLERTEDALSKEHAAARKIVEMLPKDPTPDPIIYSRPPDPPEVYPTEAERWLKERLQKQADEAAEDDDPIDDLQDQLDSEFTQSHRLLKAILVVGGVLLLWTIGADAYYFWSR